VEVVRTYLEIVGRDQFRPVRSELEGLRLEPVPACPPSFYRYLYRAVGEAYHWIDRREWSDEVIQRHLARPEIGLYVLYLAGAPVGWFELRRCEDGSQEIAYFGLLPEFQGRGLGRHLLTCAVEQAFARGGSRVWLHTCSLDHPAAIPNYEARGFRRFKTEVYSVDLPGGAVAQKPMPAAGSGSA
jgi:ribosomal protein S18 acetylase RimI-like enzyme